MKSNEIDDVKLEKLSRMEMRMTPQLRQLMEKQKANKDAPQIWTQYNVTWLFIRDLCGSVPASKDLVRIWLENRAPEVRPPGGKSIDDIQEEVIDTLANPEEAPLPLRVFQRKDGVLVIREDTVRAHLKDCARSVSSQFVGKIKGERSFATRVVNGVYLDPLSEFIPITRHDQTPVIKEDDVIDKPVHAKGPRGEPINALKSFEIVKEARVDFVLWVLGSSVSIKDLETLMRFGGTHGYGGERSAGGGKYLADIQLVE
jgi:hypothetical protein